MESFVQVTENEGDESIIEIPTEYDNSLVLNTLTAQFPQATGLRYRNAETGAIRGVRFNEGRLFPPRQGGDWGALVYFCVLPKEVKRKLENQLENSTSKTRKMEAVPTTDLIVLGLAWKTTEDNLRKHFERFGKLLMVQVKVDLKSGKSKGFGFLRFASHEVQKKVLQIRHLIGERWCEVRVPHNPKPEIVQTYPGKVFIGRCTEDLTSNDLFEYFGKFGDISDVFIPKPFRGFSFVTFIDSVVAQKLIGEDHMVKGVSVRVSPATQRIEPNCLPTYPEWNFVHPIIHHQQIRGPFNFHNFRRNAGFELPNLQDLGIGFGKDL